MLIDQAADRSQRVTMQAPQEPMRGLGLRQPASVLPIDLQRHLPEVGQQFSLAFGAEQHLRLLEVPHFAGGFAPAAATLVPPQPAEHGLQPQIVRREADSNRRLSGGRPGMSYSPNY